MTEAKHTPETITLADRILKIGGSNLKNYTLEKICNEILDAAQGGASTLADLNC